MSQYDTDSLYGFLLHTPENGLRKMLIDGKPFTDIHFNLMMKVVRNCDQSQFQSHFEKKDYPKIKLNANEIKLKEKFWDDAINTFKSRGLLTPIQTAA